MTKARLTVIFVLSAWLIGPGLATAANSQAANSDSDNILLIHSESSYGGFDPAAEFDASFEALGIKPHKVPVSKLDAEPLAGNDLVIAGSMLLRNPRNQPVWPHPDDLHLDTCGEKLRKYVESGGVLLLTDMVESDGIYSLANIAPGLAVKIDKCETGLATTFSDDALVSSPHKLASYEPNYNPQQICRRLGGKFAWGHFAGALDGWTVLARCPDRHPVLLARHIGKGTIVVSTLCAGRPIDAGLLEDLLYSARVQAGRPMETASVRLKPDYFRVKKTAPRGSLPFDSQGNILSEGKPFFPIGFYSVAESSYPILAANGFNSAYDIEPAPAAKNGLKGTLTTAWDFDQARDRTLARQKAMTEKEKATILAQRLAEEPGNLPVPPCDSNFMRGLDDVVKTVVPNRPTFVLVNNPLEFPAFSSIGELSACDPYPYKTATTPATRVGDDIDALRKLAGNPNHPVWAILQAEWFGQPGGETYLVKPTGQQLLAETYVALAHRANGVYYFAFDELAPDKSITFIHQKDGSFDEPLWSALKQSAAEIKVLNPALLSPLPPQQARFASAQNEIQSLLRQDGSRRYLMAVNPYSYAVEARLVFDDRSPRPMKLRGIFGGPDLLLTGRETKVTFAPYQRQVYAFDVRKVTRKVSQRIN